MGVVWKAEDLVLGRTVAVKLLPADMTLDEGRRRLFMDEARSASSLNDAHVAQVYELGREGDLDFIVMELVDGRPLSNLLHGRPLPPDKVAAFGTQIAQGLARALRSGKTDPRPRSVRFHRPPANTPETSGKDRSSRSCGSGLPSRSRAHGRAKERCHRYRAGTRLRRRGRAAAACASPQPHEILAGDRTGHAEEHT